MEKEISAFIPLENFERNIKGKEVAKITGLTPSWISTTAAYGNIPNEKRIHNNRVTRFYSLGEVQYFNLKRERRIRDLMDRS